MATKLLGEYCDNPLLSSIDFGEAAALLEGSFYGVGCGKEMTVIDESLYGQVEPLINYLNGTKPEDISIPVLLLEGSLHYNFKSGSLNPPPHF